MSEAAQAVARLFGVSETELYMLVVLAVLISCLWASLYRKGWFPWLGVHRPIALFDASILLSILAWLLVPFAEPAPVLNLKPVVIPPGEWISIGPLPHGDRGQIGMLLQVHNPGAGIATIREIRTSLVSLGSEGVIEAEAPAEWEHPIRIGPHQEQEMAAYYRLDGDSAKRLARNADRDPESVRFRVTLDVTFAVEGVRREGRSRLIFEIGPDGYSIVERS